MPHPLSCSTRAHMRLSYNPFCASGRRMSATQTRNSCPPSPPCPTLRRRRWAPPSDLRVLRAPNTQRSYAQVDGGRLAELLAVVTEAIETLDCDRTRQLLLIRTSERYVERLAGSVQQKKDHITKMEAKVDDAQDRIDTLQAEKAASLPKYAELAARSRSLKQKLADGISALFDGRPVNIMGDVTKGATS